ncbi:DUF2238 domain-containing protein [Candidatus Pacearchaeota archaeon]|nr:DUF2238 domain-containing protein [Candidatus Pacearchaeota archaeon]
MNKKYWLLILFNLAYIVGFTFYYTSIKNYEFLLYIAVLVALFILVLGIQKKVKFSYAILWMLSIWGLLHMMGGGAHLPSGTVLYKWVPFVAYDGTSIDSDFIILKFDQVLHFYIYFVMSIILAHLFKSHVKDKRFLFYFLITMASVGVSALNELVEFSAVVFLGKTGVGGYYNTLLDLLFNTLGAIVGSTTAYFLNKR